jgi:drug/metabolite transporter (DMT)-like permease
MTNIDRLFSRFSSNFLLFITCAGIWGSTWLVIKYQLRGADPIESVFYRFLISTTILFVFARSTGRSLSYPKKDHINFFFQGSCNFSINYIITYWAETHAHSATVALAFTLLVAYNILGMKFFFKKAIGPNVYVGTLLGVVGIAFIFGQELVNLSEGSPNIMGLGLGFIATFFASAGNLLSYRNHLNKIPITIANAWGMFYGTLMTLIIAIVLHKPLHVDTTVTYWLSLLYLSIFGTVIAFGAYLTLVGRIGAERAGYTSILSPVIAVILSSLFEDFKITIYVATGLAFCLLGNYISLKASKTTPHR